MLLLILCVAFLLFSCQETGSTVATRPLTTVTNQPKMTDNPSNHRQYSQNPSSDIPTSGIPTASRATDTDLNVEQFQENDAVSHSNNYAWLDTYHAEQSLSQRIAVPQGYIRANPVQGSFAEWLQHLPLKAGKPDVLLYNGQRKGNQTAHEAVLDIDVGNKDLQQCADAIMRLRAEYLWSAKKYDAIHFRYTSGHNASYSQWRQGYRPSIVGSSVTWNKTNAPDNSYTSFKKYLQQVFTYCGTSSLSKELKSVEINDLQAGDVFIRGGFPGHAVIVLDVAQQTGGKKVFLLAQSYMPAQEIHLLRNPNNTNLSPWYETTFGTQLITPEWEFTADQLKRF